MSLFNLRKSAVLFCGISEKQNLKKIKGKRQKIKVVSMSDYE